MMILHLLIKKICVDNSQKHLSDPDVAPNLVYIKSNFGFLPDVITCLEAKNIPLSDRIEIIENAYLKLYIIYIIFDT